MSDADTPGRVGGLIGLARVRGHSMRPTLRPGDRLLVTYVGRVRPGRIVLARFADGTLAVKRAAERRATRTGLPGWWLVSDDPAQGIDSRHRGPVPESDVVAVVLARMWPWPRPIGGPRRTSGHAT